MKKILLLIVLVLFVPIVGSHDSIDDKLQEGEYILVKNFGIMNLVNATTELYNMNPHAGGKILKENHICLVTANKRSGDC